ncbi:MAG: LacI family DNA-binding transcriptional regulator [Sphaerochaetaceae bacterium]|nr:LacI family DNA-binding transcriptional regulator [Sphaerochaetaceae bacterium]MDC7237288.1 LacI family DNA-binding transcriptional regulator [Sphaerochaetaceae bacterium]MDC7250620.1 LacI family DNA-binding transcriptional regulator [Sphaerochaetaceae bacterium]
MNTTIKRVTRKDVAERANVSPTIVSYVINNNRYVDSEKRKRVEKALKELGYKPNAIARALKGKQSNHILFIVDDLQSEHFSKIMKQMDSWAFENNYFISLCESRNSDSFVNQVHQRYFDAILIASGTFKQKYIQALINTQIPIVILEMRKYDKLSGDFGLINTGLYEGARLCCKTLIEKQRDKLLFIDSFESMSFTKSTKNDFRYKGFIDELKMHNYVESINYKIISSCKNEKELQLKLEEVINSGFKVNGVFGRTDSVAIHTMYKLIDMGYRIPKDCSIIGVNNARISRYTTPQVTTLDINREAIGKSIIKILEQLFHKEENPTLNISLQTSLIKRKSL